MEPIALNQLDEPSYVQTLTDEELISRIKTSRSNGRFSHTPDPEMIFFWLIATGIVIIIAIISFIVCLLTAPWTIWIFVALGAVPAFFFVGMGLTLAAEAIEDYKSYRCSIKEARKRNLIK